MEIFSKAPVMQAVFKSALPAMAAMLMVLVYNLADTFFIGQTHDALQVATVSLAMKVTVITGMICMGLGQGIQPLLGYCAGAKLWSRFKEVFKFSAIFAFILGASLTILCYLSVNTIVNVFLTDATAFDYAVRFSRILLTTSSLFGLFYVLVNGIQAMGEAAASLVISLSRQGIIYIPALFILKAALGMTGPVWAQPILFYTAGHMALL